MKSKKKPRIEIVEASGISVYCKHDGVKPAVELKLWSEQPGSKNPQVHPPAQLDRAQ